MPTERSTRPVAQAQGNWVEIGDTTTGTYNLSGGSITAANNEFTIGRNGRANGVMNTSRSATINVLSAARGLEIGGDTSGGNGSGTLNVTNGILTVNASSIRIGSTGGSTGVMNVAGTSVVNLSGFANVGAAGSGTLNLNDSSTLNALGGLAGNGTVTNAGTGVANSSLNLGVLNGTGNQTFSGQIVDSSTAGINVTVKGGTQVFSTDQAYLGNTVITGGTLQLGNGGLTGSVITPTISNAGTLAINHSGTFSFTNQVSGTGGVLINGPGAVQFPNTYNYSGPTVVATGSSGGTLFLMNGTTSNNIPNSSTINVQSGTLDATGLLNGTLATNGQNLRGAGTVTGTAVTVQGGSITPGNSPAIGTLNINGDLTIGNGVATNFVLGTPGASLAAVGIGSLINVTGNLTLGTGLPLTALNNSNANGQGSSGLGYYELISYGGTQSGFDPSLTFTTPIVANFSFSNTAHAGGGGEIDVYIALLRLSPGLA